MILIDIIKQAFTDLQANKLRSTLTLFGIIWGIMAIMILLGWGFGFRDFMVKGMSQIGEDLIFFEGGHTSTGVGGYKTGRPVVPTLKDIEAIEKLCPSVESVNPQISKRYYLKCGNESRRYQIRGVLPNAKSMNNWYIANGRFFSDLDLKNRRRFVFLGHSVKEEMFGKNKNPLGEKLRINGITFQVIGVAEEKKMQTTQIGSQHNDQVLVPISTAQQLWGDGRSLDLIFVKPKADASSKQAAQEIKELMAERHHYDPKDPEALFLMEFAFFQNMLKYLTMGLNILLGLIGMVTLAIGGIGVMNIMFLSVQERTKEIGVRKSVGAKKRDIRLQFLAEGLVITSIGGTVGFLLGSALLGGLNLLPLPEFIPLPQNSIELSLIVVLIMIFVGVTAGYIPAKNAANLQPVEALHFERATSSKTGKDPKPLWTSRTLTGELIGQAVLEIRANKSRTFLTVFGIFWGIASIIMLIGFGTGFQGFFEREYGKMGSKVIRVYPGRVKTEKGTFRTGNRIRFGQKDIDALHAFKNEIEYAIPEYDCNRPVFKYGNENRAVHTLGVVPQTEEMRGFEVAEGRFINQGDLDEERRICFLGATIKERLFGSRKTDVVGKYIKVKGIRYRVIGAAKPKGMQLSINNSLDDEKMLIPITTAKKDFSEHKYFSRILVSPVDRNRYRQTEKEIRAKLSQIHGFQADDKDAVRIYSQLRGLEEIGPIVLALQVFLGGVGVVTLIIGAVGVMNIMFFIVTQRLREIGVRRAVGAFGKHIFQQFLTEALLITLVGGIIGFLIGWGLNFVLSALVDMLRAQDVSLMMLFAPQNSWAVSMITVIFMVTAGFLAGITPALRAMRANIVDCLRYE